MSTPESELWKWFNKNIGKRFDYCKRVETKYADGFPDVILCNHDKVFPLELKVSKKEPKKVPLRKDQVLWWQDWMRCGGFNGAILMKFEDKIAIINPHHVTACANLNNEWQHLGHIIDIEDVSEIYKKLMYLCAYGWY